ncbi:MAG: T9SS type A sorting domain-containing protein [Chitinophagaceae bacterium]
MAEDYRPFNINIPTDLSKIIAITVISPGNYNYSIIDFNGKTIISGRLLNGINNINAGMVIGMYVIRFKNNDQQWTDKLLRQ